MGVAAGIALASGLVAAAPAPAEPPLREVLAPDPTSGEGSTTPPAEPPPQRELTWDDVAPATPPPTPTPTPTPAVTPATESSKAKITRPTDEVLEATRRSGTAMLIGAGSASALGLVLNGVRTWLVTGPCQTEAQSGCSVGWFVSTPFTWGANAAAVGLAVGGGRDRGEADGWLRTERQARRTPMLISLGIPFIGIGIATSITFRALWLADYGSPEGAETFDFAQPGHAFAYYGVQQASAMLVALGAGMLSYQAAGRSARARASMVRPLIGPTFAGIGFSGRM